MKKIISGIVLCISLLFLTACNTAVDDSGSKSKINGITYSTSRNGSIVVITNDSVSEVSDRQWANIIESQIEKGYELKASYGRITPTLIFEKNRKRELTK